MKTFTLSLASFLLAFTAQAQIAVKGQVILTMAGEPILDGVVVIENGKITKVGPIADVAIPANATLLEAAYVVPGLIDAHSTVGFSGYMNQPHDQDQFDRSEALQPELRAIDAYNAREVLIDWVRRHGVTTIHTGHAPGPLVSGQTLVAKLHGESVDESVIVPCAMVAATLASPSEGKDKKSPGTRARQSAVLRQALVDAQAWAAKKAKKPDDTPRNLRNEILSRVLAREVPLMITADAHQDILTALRIRDEFGIDLVLDSAADAHSLLPELTRAKVPVLVHPTMARPEGDRRNLSLENAAKLREAGLTIALQAGYEGYVPKTRVVLWEAAMTAANGLSHRDAMATITIDAARILKLDKRIGSIEVGKDGDLALFDGDPFEWTTHCLGTVIEGTRFAGE